MEQQPVPQYQAPTPVPTVGSVAEDPGKTLGIVGLILAFLFPLVGLILSIIANNKSKSVGLKNGMAKAGIILSSVFMVLGIVAIIAVFALGMLGASSLSQTCKEKGPGVYTSGDSTITCKEDGSFSIKSGTN